MFSLKQLPYYGSYIIMVQRYKSVYFVDCPGDSPKERNLTLAFGKRDSSLFQSVKSLTSHEIRELIGHSSYQSLRQEATQQNVGLNTHCLGRLRARLVDAQGDTSLPFLPGMVDSFSTSPIDPLQSTYRGGLSEPLHDWYPYLEGYSPKFVSEAIQEFSPRASRVLDPFAGTGTTPLTVPRLGGVAFYCELNPLLQYLIETKAVVLRLNETGREKAAEGLRRLVGTVQGELRNLHPDEGLRSAYDATFGSSQFFDRSVFERVLKLRTLVDHVGCDDLLAARLLTVAVLATLVPASRLIRRGDVRYKTPQEAQRLKTDLLQSVEERLEAMSADILRLSPLQTTPLLVCENAAHLRRVENLRVDTVMTSPPYLNGTNYFRNTKLELWFLRCLGKTEDLARFRFKAVTAGINDVTVAKTEGEPIPECAEVVRKLEASAYDMRIPRMVAMYFSEMRSVFASIQEHLTERATVMIDIGDSAYGNVHVATDIILSDILRNLGFTLRRQITLRKRMSRGGFPLRQVLLVFDWAQPKRKSALTISRTSTWADTWSKFKSDLPHQQGHFAKRNWGNPLHSLCSYQGKMKPSLAYHLIKTFTSRGGVILDPFAGVGTIPFEAALQGIATFSFDISPAALHISRGKLGLADRAECADFIAKIERYLHENRATPEQVDRSRKISFNGPLPNYFHERTFREVLLARQFFSEHPPSSASGSLVMASLLHILHGNRPYALSRRSHPITPFAPTGPVEYKALVSRLREKVDRCFEVDRPREFVEGRVFCQDATAWWPQEIDELDAIITSPPFFDSTRFYLANWMRLWFCGWEAEDFRSQPSAYIDERQKRSFSSYEPIFRQARERLRPGGVIVLHLRKSKKCDMAEALTRIAAPWFQVADIYSEEVAHCESHGIRDKGTVTAHQFLILR